MLQRRILTAIVLFLCLIAVAFYASDLVFSLFLSVLTLLAAWEWGQLAGFKSFSGRTFYCLFLIGSFALSYVALAGLLIPVLLFSILFWVACFYLVLAYPSLSASWDKPVLLAVAGFIVLFPGWYGLLALRESTHFVFVFLGLFLLVAAADSGAYFSGKSLGKHKLAPVVSPNKTWEGAIGGLLTCVLTSCVYFLVYACLSDNQFSWFVVLLAPVLVTVFSIIGDLVESMLKRVRNIKDSGNLLPGHGGVLDRIDGIVAASPVYLLIMFYFL